MFGWFFGYFVIWYILTIVTMILFAQAYYKAKSWFNKTLRVFFTVENPDQPGLRLSITVSDGVWKMSMMKWKPIIQLGCNYLCWSKVFDHFQFEST